MVQFKFSQRPLFTALAQCLAIGCGTTFCLYMKRPIESMLTTSFRGQHSKKKRKNKPRWTMVARSARSHFSYNFHGLPYIMRAGKLRSRDEACVFFFRFCMCLSNCNLCIYCHSQRRRQRRCPMIVLCCDISNRFSRSFKARVPCNVCLCLFSLSMQLFCVHAIRHYDCSHILDSAIIQF